MRWTNLLCGAFTALIWGCSTQGPSPAAPDLPLAAQGAGTGAVAGTVALAMSGAGSTAPSAGAAAAGSPAGAAGEEPPEEQEQDTTQAGRGEPTPAGRQLAPPGVCTAPASARTPCHDDPDPCGINSGWPGDEYCLLPPPPGEGIQIHYGPANYDDPAEVQKYVLEAGVEVNDYGIAHIPTGEERYYNFVQLRMRPNSHHLINRVVPRQAAEGLLSSAGCPGEGMSTHFVGTQNPVRDDPANGIVAPENEGLGRRLPGNSSLCVNQHAYNFGEGPVLREVWINVYFMDEDEVTQTENRIAVNAPIGTIAPGEQRTLSASATVQGDGRITTLLGHRHAWTTRFAVFHNERLVYDSWDWVESVVFDYNSATQNPALNPQLQVDGAVSGILEVKDGDTIRTQCDVDNQSDRTLRFANEAYNGEMCILFGASVGATIRGGSR